MHKMHASCYASSFLGLLLLIALITRDFLKSASSIEGKREKGELVQKSAKYKASNHRRLAEVGLDIASVSA